MTLVVGATGMVGTEICRLIAASGRPVTALVRASSNAAKVENLKRLGVTIVQGDSRSPIAQGRLRRRDEGRQHRIVHALRLRARREHPTAD